MELVKKGFGMAVSAEHANQNVKVFTEIKSKIKYFTKL